MSPETCEYLDGPCLATWLDEHGMESEERELGFHARRVREWRAGGSANVYTVDKVLVKLGLHLSQIPEDFWLEDFIPPVTGRPHVYSDAFRERAVDLVKQGQSAYMIAKEMGCSRNAVIAWSRRAGL